MPLHRAYDTVAPTSSQQAAHDFKAGERTQTATRVMVVTDLNHETELKVGKSLEPDVVSG